MTDSPQNGSPINGKPKPDEKPPSQADLLVELVRSKGELCHDAYDETYTTIVEDGRRRTLRLRTRAARAWMDRQFFETFHKVPGGQAKADAIATLEGIALHDRAVRAVHVRTSEYEGRIYIDLGDESREVVEVGPEGWRVLPFAPVCFYRPKGLLALPRPVAGGSADDLREFVNTTSDAHFRLVVAWMLAALRPRGPYPILCLQGEHGSSKSTTTRFIRRLVDPNVLPVRSAPREIRDLAIAARSAHVLALDNLSGLPAWLSDALCQVSTGGGFATRTLCTDDEETLFDFVKPIVINGIDDVATRSDFADRCLIVTLAPIAKAKRRRERDLAVSFEAAAPRIFGAVLSAVSGAIVCEPHVQLPELPRMADFATFVTAAEPALGWRPSEFLAAYTANQTDATAVALDADLVAQVVQRFMADRADWSGQAKDLLEDLRPTLSEHERDNKLWPKAPNVLSGKLRRAAPVLRELGIEVDLDSSEGRGAGKRRQVVIRTVGGTRSFVPIVHSRESAGESPDGAPSEESSPFTGNRPRDAGGRSRGRFDDAGPPTRLQPNSSSGDDGVDGDDPLVCEAESGAFSDWLSEQGITQPPGSPAGSENAPCKPQGMG